MSASGDDSREVPGALLHVGDMHARQGQYGEICGGGGIRRRAAWRACRVEVGRQARSNMTWPRIENCHAHHDHGCRPSPAEDAFRIALSERDHKWLGDDYGSSEEGRLAYHVSLRSALTARVTSTSHRQPVVFLHSQSEQEVPGVGRRLRLTAGNVSPRTRPSPHRTIQTRPPRAFFELRGR